MKRILATISLALLCSCAAPIQMQRYDKTPETPTVGAVVETVAVGYLVSIAFNFCNTIYINNGFPR